VSQDAEPTIETNEELSKSSVSNLRSNEESNQRNVARSEPSDQGISSNAADVAAFTPGVAWIRFRWGEESHSEGRLQNIAQVESEEDFQAELSAELVDEDREWMTDEALCVVKPRVKSFVSEMKLCSKFKTLLWWKAFNR
jgi:hypothetical protein